MSHGVLCHQAIMLKMGAVFEIHLYTSNKSLGDTVLAKRATPLRPSC
jgi:hypothetical protein